MSPAERKVASERRLGREGATFGDVLRCDCCGHPMGREIWELDPRDPHTTPEGKLRSRYLAAAERVLRDGGEPVGLGRVPYSACDEGCRHGGPVRARHPGEQAWEHWGRELALPSLPATYAHAEVQASWRPVEACEAGVLCLRCSAERLQP